MSKKSEADKGQTDIEFFSNMHIMYGNPDEAKAHIKACFDAGEVPGIMGHAGIGKTAAVHEIVKEFSKRDGKQWGLRVIHLQHLEKEDIAGFPFEDPDDQHAVILRVLKRLPREGKCEENGILFFDEFNRADKPVTNAVFPLMEEKRIGDWSLPKGWHVVIAGNISDDQYAVNETEKDPAIRRRINWYGVHMNSHQWLEWASREGLHPAVIAYIATNPDRLHDYEAIARGSVAGNPASWEKVSHTLLLLEKEKSKPELPTSKLAGNVGLTSAIEFERFYKNEMKKAPGPQAILDNFSSDPTIKARLKGLNSGEIANLTTGLVKYIASTEIDLNKSLNNIVGFLGTLTPEMFSTWLNQLIVETMQQGTSDAPNKFFTQLEQLQDRILSHPEYVAKAAEMTRSTQKLEKDSK